MKVIAYNDIGEAAEEKMIVTAGKLHCYCELEADRRSISANGEDISFVTASVVDKNGNPSPTASNRLNFEVNGNGKFRAVCNGDAVSLELFHKPSMKVFNGKLVVLVQAASAEGEIELRVSGDGLKENKLKYIPTKMNILCAPHHIIKKPSL